MCPNLERTVRSFIIMVQTGHDQLVDILLIGSEVRGSQHHQPSGSNQSGVYVLMGSIQLISPTL